MPLKNVSVYRYIYKVLDKNVFYTDMEMCHSILYKNRNMELKKGWKSQSGNKNKSR